MRQRARTDLCGGRSAMIVPTAPTGPSLETRIHVVAASVFDQFEGDRPKRYPWQYDE